MKDRQTESESLVGTPTPIDQPGGVFIPCDLERSWIPYHMNPDDLWDAADQIEHDVATGQIQNGEQAMKHADELRRIAIFRV